MTTKTMHKGLTPKKNGTTTWRGLTIYHEETDDWNGDAFVTYVQVSRKNSKGVDLWCASIELALDNGEDVDGNPISQVDLKRIEKIEAAYTAAGLY